MITHKDASYVVGGVLGADVVGTWIRTEAIERFVATFTLHVSLIGSNDSILVIEGTNDPAKVSYAELTYANATTSEGGTPTQVVFFNGPVPEWVRVAYRHRFADPAVGTVDIRVLGRAP